MENENVEKLKRQFNKLYFDTTKHCQDIEKWIKLGNRKQGDIRRSLNRLDKKYETLCELRTELRKNNIAEQEVLNYISNQKNQVNLAQIKGKMETLYNLAGLEKPRQSMYGDDIEIVEDIEQKFNTEPSNQTKSMYNDQGFIFNIPEGKRESGKRIKSMSNDVELVNDIQNGEENILPLKHKEKSLTTKVKEKFGKVKEKIKNITSGFRNSKEENIKPKRSLAKRFAALAMASTLAIFGGATIKESMSKADDTKNNKSYTDTNNLKNDFKDSIYIQALEDTETTKPSVETIQNNRNTQNVQQSTEIARKSSNEKENKEDTEDLFLAHSNTKYTEVSDGSGKMGYFTKDTKVKIYNRALVKTAEDGSKQILKATKIGQTWEQFAKENKIDYKEFKQYIENNENIQECVSVQSEDEKTLYGWLSLDKLEQIEQEQEVER